MFAAILKSKFFQFAGTVVLVLIIFFLAQQLYRKYQINQEIKGLENEIAFLQTKNQDILKVINYLKTSEYRERQARSLLGLQKPGEFAVALPGDEPVEQTLGAGVSAQSGGNSNFIKWWRYFFSK